MSKYTANPKALKNHTQSTENSISTETRSSANFLPGIFQTETNKRFFKATLDQLLSSSSTESLDTYWGKVGGAKYRSNVDLFNAEHSATRTNYQLAPGTSIVSTDSVEEGTSYINAINNLKYVGSDTVNHDSLMTEPGYALSLPIDSDMFINFTNYYWLSENIPVCVVNPTAANPINIDHIAERATYTTPELSNGKTLELVSGMRVQFTGANVSGTEHSVDNIYFVEGVGKQIRLVLHVDSNDNIVFNQTQVYSPRIPEPWDIFLWDELDWDDSVYLNLRKDYIVANRGDCSANAWARSNQWYSFYALQNTVGYLDLNINDYATAEASGNRPIICYDADLELMDAGTSALTNIDEVVIGNDTPETNIVGQASYNSVTDTITTEWTSQVYNVGDRVYSEDADSNVTYYECILEHTVATNPGAFGNQATWKQLIGESVKEGDRLLFINSANVDYNDKIFTVTGVGTSIVLTDVTGTLNDTDKVHILRSASETYAGAEMHFNGVTWVFGQQKLDPSTPPLFQLYNDAGVKLDSLTNADFVGNNIFTYKVNSAGVEDAELGFAPTYNESSSDADYKFNFDIQTVRYNQGATPTEVKGLYFYKNHCTGTYHSGWEPVREDQRVPVVKTHIATDTSAVSFDLGTTEYNFASNFVIGFDNGKYQFAAKSYFDIADFKESNPTIVLHKGTTYTFEKAIKDNTHDLEFVDPNGFTLTDVTVSTTGNTVTISVGAGYDKGSIVYRSTTDNSISGTFFIIEEFNKRISLTRNGKRLIENTDFTVDTDILNVTATPTVDDVFELSYIANEQVDNAVYDVAPVHKYNPINKDFTNVFYSNLFDHFHDQMITAPGFNGETFGRNNYHMIPQNTYGGTIREQMHSPSKLTWLTNNNSLNPFNAAVSVANDYQVFKNIFKTKIRQVYDSYSDKEIYELVDIALQEINVGKSKDFKYARSDMAFYEDLDSQDIGIDVGSAQTVFSLTASKHNFGETNSHFYVYAYEFNGTKFVWKTLSEGRDYTITTNTLTLTNAILDDSVTPAALRIRSADFGNLSFIPPSAVKLGLFRPTEVEIVDGVLIGHDGSKHTLTGTEVYNSLDDDFDIIGAALLDLETRIISNMSNEHNVVNNIDVDLPNAHFPTGYTWSNIATQLDDWYNRYASRSNVNEIHSDIYDAADKFTWNYSAVTPFIGGWEGVYTYFFGTTRPHTHPWEMLGHNRKPTWWDANYSWTDATKRTALLGALQNGVVGNPTDSKNTNIKYARTAYDWNTNTLVTTAGVLNDPVTANVVTQPTAIQAAGKFVFGDWGPVETLWRATSEYKFAILDVLLQNRPYRTFEQTWLINNIVEVTGLNTAFVQNVHKKDNVRDSFNDRLHLSNYTGGAITDIDVIDGGTGYTTATATVTTELETPTITVAIEDGAVVGLSLEGASNGYPNTFDVTITGDGTNAYAIADVQQAQQRTVLGLNNGILEWANTYNVNADELATTIAKINSTLMLHVGGYTDKNILDISIDGSYQKGRTSIPSPDYNIMLQKSVPTHSVFYSGVRIVKTATTFKVYGYDSNSRSFTTAVSSFGGKSLAEQVGAANVTRYLNFLGTTQDVRYGAEFRKRQELYTFLVELGKHYEDNGFNNFGDWIQSANSAIEWTLSAEEGQEYKFNGITDTLGYKQPAIGYVDNIAYIYDGTANVLDADSRQIATKDILVLRDTENANCPGVASEYTTEFSTKTDADIYGLRVNVVEYEHVIAFQNRTQFNDVIYDPIVGIQQPRIKLVGERTRNWNGKVEAPGYLVRSTGIVTNIESSIREIENDNINTESKTLSRDTRDTARFNVGYAEPTYLTNTFVEDNSAYTYGKGLRKYKGTQQAITAMMRNNNLFGTTADHTLSEDWMIRLGEYGDTSKSKPIEFQLEFDLIKSSPQLIRFGESTDNVSDMIVDITPTSSSLVSGDITTAPFDLLPRRETNNTLISTATTFADHAQTSELPLSTEADYEIKSIDDLPSVYDRSEDYALILPWSSTVAYFEGDNVRKDGKVYRLNDGVNTGLTNNGADIEVIGTVINPVAAHNSTFIIDGTTVTFAETSINYTYTEATALGGTVNPTPAHGSTLTIDGNDVTFNKTATVITYDDIEVTGLVTNPTFTPATSSSDVLTLDGVNITFNDTETVTTNINMLTALTDGTSISNTHATARINALEALRVAYIALTDAASWTTWNNAYFNNSNIDKGLNTGYLSTEYLDAANASIQTEILALIDADVDIINAIQSTSYVTANVADGTVPVVGSDETAAKATVSSGTYVDSVTSTIYDAANANNTIALTTVVTTTSSTQPKVYTITEVLAEINGATVPDITASNDGNALKITKTLVDNSVVDTLTIAGTASLLAELGLTAGTTTASGTGAVVGQDLTLAEAITQITSANITGIVATDSGSQLLITKTTSSGNLTITTSGTTAFGSFTIIPGTETANTVNESSTVNEVITSINNAGISGVTARNSNDRIVLDSTNASLIIGTGTANIALGYQTGTTFALDEAVENIFNPSDWTEIADPAVFRTWLLDNVGSEITDSARSIGYNVYQVLDFEQIVVSVETGITENGDTTQVRTKLPHNVQENDYVMLIGTASIPSVDGIHRVTGLVDSTQFYIDEFIDNSGYGAVNATATGTEISPTTTAGQTLIINGVTTSFYGGDITSAILDLEASFDTAGVTDVTFENTGNKLKIISNIVDLVIDASSTALTVFGLTAGTTTALQAAGTPAGKMLVLRPMRFPTLSALNNATVTSSYVNGSLGLQAGMIAYVDDYDNNGVPAAYTYTDTAGVFTWELLRSQPQTADNTALESVRIYDAVNAKVVRTYEAFDPAKGIIPGIVDREIDIRRDSDVAIYNSATDTSKETVQTRAWGQEHVGTTWWNKENAIYLNYEQSELEYRQANWGKLFDTGSIDIYEWTRSNVLPEEYDLAVTSGAVVDGIELTGTPFKVVNQLTEEVYYYWTESIEYNSETESDETYYYFWVQNKTSIPGNKDRTYTTLQLTEILKDPTAANVYWFAACSDSTVLINNLNDLIGNDDLVVQVNFANSATDLHREYLLLSENDPKTVIPEWLHFGLRNSIVGYDTTKTTYTYTDWQVATTYLEGNVVLKDSEYYLANADSVGVDPATVTNTSVWQQLYNVNANPDGEFVDGSIQVPAPKLVPDPTLHKFNKLGTEIRPRQTWIDNTKEARRVMVDKLNRQLKTINVVRQFKDWDTVLNGTVSNADNTSATHKVARYWGFVDWSASDYTIGTDFDRIVEQRSVLDSVTDAIKGELALARTSIHKDNISRREVYRYNGTSWDIVFNERATIEFNDKIWNFEDTSTPWNNEASVVLANVLDVMRDTIFVAQFASYYADMWFTMLNYIHSEQKGLNWAFRSTYIKVAVELLLDQESRRYFESKDSELEEYINAVKPFHSKLRDFVVARTLNESMTVDIEEGEAKRNIWINAGDLEGTGWIGDELDGQDFTTNDDSGNVDAGSFTTVDNSFEYVYTGDSFVILDNYDFGDEVYPAIFRETLEMRVQTNTSGATEDAATRSFRLFLTGYDNNLEATVISNTHSTTLASDISSSDIAIDVVDASNLYDPATTTAQSVVGVVFIGNERIEYTGIAGNTLLGCKRGAKTTGAKAHSATAKVVDASQRRWIRYPRNIQSYSTNDAPLFNELGKSLLDDNSVRIETVIIQDAGEGTIG